MNMKRLLKVTVLVAVIASPAVAEDPGPPRLMPVPIPQGVIEHNFWSPKLKVWGELTIPDCLARFENDGALTIFDPVRSRCCDLNEKIESMASRRLVR